MSSGDSLHKSFLHLRPPLLDKIMIIDGDVVITGSFNFTKAAEQANAENLLVIRSRDLADQYTRNWEAHAAHSEPYVGRGR